MTRAVVFAEPRRIEIQGQPAPIAGPGQAVVRTSVSGISAGSELLIYHGHAPADLAADATLPALGGGLEFPLKYGYACAGTVIAVGAGADPALVGRPVFAFHPHQTRFAAAIEDLILLPEGLDPERAVLLPNMETAIGLVHDGRPLAGEHVAVFGQGVVGLLTTGLLAEMALDRLVTIEAHAPRRQASLRAGAHLSLEPDQHLEFPGGVGADLAYELTGDPAALDRAIAAVGFEGRVVIGSWYGRRRADLDLGGRFHRSRIHLIPSQVSTIASALRGRWSRSRRLTMALDRLDRPAVADLITHRFPFEDAAAAYRLLDQAPAECLQVVLTYPPDEGA